VNKRSHQFRCETEEKRNYRKTKKERGKGQSIKREVQFLAKLKEDYLDQAKEKYDVPDKASIEKLSEESRADEKQNPNVVKPIHESDSKVTCHQVKELPRITQIDPEWKARTCQQMACPIPMMGNQMLQFFPIQLPLMPFWCPGLFQGNMQFPGISINLTSQIKSNITSSNS
jgi:hypothetical protein